MKILRTKVFSILDRAKLDQMLRSGKISKKEYQNITSQWANGRLKSDMRRFVDRAMKSTGTVHDAINIRGAAEVIGRGKEINKLLASEFGSSKILSPSKQSTYERFKDRAAQAVERDSSEISNILMIRKRK